MINLPQQFSHSLPDRPQEEVAVVTEAPPEGWVKVGVLCEDHLLQMYVGESHSVKSLIKYVNSILSKDDSGFEGECAATGLTSTWALADGGLVFCEDDSIFELDG